MPIYEFRCGACGKRTAVFVRSMSSPVRAACEHCGSKKLTRLMSKFSVGRASTRGGDGDEFGDMEDFDESDPRAMARMARRMQDEMGEEMAPEMDEALSRIEAGEDPDAVMAEAGLGDAGDFGDDDFASDEF